MYLLAMKYAEKRSKCLNAHNGKAYIGCMIGRFDKRCVL